MTDTSSNQKLDCICMKINFSYNLQLVKLFTSVSLYFSSVEKLDPDYILCVKRDVFPILSMLSRNGLEFKERGTNTKVSFSL